MIQTLSYIKDELYFISTLGLSISSSLYILDLDITFDFWDFILSFWLYLDFLYNDFLVQKDGFSILLVIHFFMILYFNFIQLYLFLSMFWLSVGQIIGLIGSLARVLVQVRLMSYARNDKFCIRALDLLISLNQNSSNIVFRNSKENFVLLFERIQDFRKQFLLYSFKIKLNSNQYLWIKFITNPSQWVVLVSLFGSTLIYQYGVPLYCVCSCGFSISGGIFHGFVWYSAKEVP